MDVTRVQRYGNSLFVCVTQAYADMLSLSKGDLVTVQLTEEGLLIKKLEIPKKGKEEENV